MNKKSKFTAKTLTLSAAFLLPTSAVMADERADFDDITMDVIESYDASDLLNEIELPELNDERERHDNSEREIENKQESSENEQEESEDEPEVSENEQDDSEDEQEDSEDEQEDSEDEQEDSEDEQEDSEDEQEDS
ncbi:MAG: hypothetical protein GY694_05545, partial [Gammaproteobacteria bacterium]|nr:hypothetical protein [Gammaproteobacteria bacterium]